MLLITNKNTTPIIHTKKNILSIFFVAHINVNEFKIKYINPKNQDLIYISHIINISLD